MPLYDFYCSVCNQQFETFCKISEREALITQKPFVDCPTQSSQCNVEQKTGLALNIGDSWHVGTKHVSQDFKDRLVDIKRSHPGSNINVPP